MAVSIKRERPDQRRHHRVTAPLFVDYKGIRTRAADWSLGGLRIEEFRGSLPQVDEQVELSLSLPFQGFDISFEATARVVRRNDKDGMFAVEFTQIGEREMDLMRHFIDELVRGSMSDAETTIQRIDVPVTPASLQPDKNPAQDVPVVRRSYKALAMTGFYLVLGVFVFGYIAALVYSNMYRLEVQTAVISAPIEVVAAQAEGRLKWGGVRPGDSVTTGEKLLTLYDNKLEQEIEFSSLAVEDSRLQLAYLRRRQVDEIEKVEGFAAIELKNAAQMKLEVEGITEEVAAAKKDYLRHAQLNKKGFSTTAKMEQLKKNYLTTLKKLESRKLELDMRVRLAEHNLGKRHYTGQNMVGEVQRIAAEVKRAEGRLKLAAKKHKSLIMHRDRLAIYAPFNGFLMKLPKVNNGHVKKGDILAVLEDSSRRYVTAFLKQDEILFIKLGELVDIYIPAVDKWLAGKVTGIDRTDGFIKQNNRRGDAILDWRGPTARSAKVTINFLKPDIVRRSKIYKTGLPVVVIFKKESTNMLITGAKRHLNAFWQDLPTRRRISKRSMQGLRAWWALSNRLSSTAVKKISSMSRTGRSLYRRWQNSSLHQRLFGHALRGALAWRKLSARLSDSLQNKVNNLIYEKQSMHDLLEGSRRKKPAIKKALNGLAAWARLSSKMSLMVASNIRLFDRSPANTRLAARR